MINNTNRTTADSINGVKLSKHGKPIVFLPSKSIHGRSNIVFALPPGTGISITRSVRHIDIGGVFTCSCLLYVL
jgi:Acetyl-CoA hydrolase/transferase C-terminal domain